MFTFFHKENEQKELYFQLKSIIDNNSTKARGIYAIFQDDLCVYVGQSKNISSRTATHLKGRYHNCTSVKLWLDYEDMEDLIPSEKFAIQQLKPTENIIADYSEKIDKDLLIERFIQFKPSSYDYRIMNFKYNLFVSDSECNENLYSNEKLRTFFKNEINEVEKFLGAEDVK